MDQTEMATVDGQNKENTSDLSMTDKSPSGPEVKNSIWCKRVMVPFSLVAAILVFQQISGIDSIVFYTVAIFQNSGTPIGEYEATMLVGLVQLLATILSLFLIDYFGRKPLLLTSSLLMSVSMAGLGTYFYLYSRGNGADLGLLPLISQFVFIGGFSIGYSNIPFILMGELLPVAHRSLLSAIAGACNLGSMFIIIKTFPNLVDVLGSEGAFWIYAGFCLISFFFVYFLLPESKGKTLDEIQQHFENKFPSEVKPFKT